MTTIASPTVHRIVGGTMVRFTQAPPVQPLRDPLKWPHPSDSMWNMPIGQSANLVPLNFAFNYTETGDTIQSIEAARIFIEEENILGLDPDAPLQFIQEHDAGWTGAIRCASRTGSNLVGNGTVPAAMMEKPIATGWTTDPDYIGSRPNMSGALVYRDGPDLKLFETQPLHICTDGVAVSQFINHTMVGDSLITGGYGAHPDRPLDDFDPPFDDPANLDSWGQGGSHGGSFMTAFGGTIRLGELVQGGEIPHALKIVCDTGVYCSQTAGIGHRWPALRADGGDGAAYGNLAASWGRPTPPAAAKMGMLLTVPADFGTEGLRTEPGRILARAVQRYGAYLVDGNHGAVRPYELQWQVERSNEGRFHDEFFAEFGYRAFHKNGPDGSPSPAQLDWRLDVGEIAEAFHIVDDNMFDNVGGAGARRWTMAPPLAT